MKRLIIYKGVMKDIGEVHKKNLQNLNKRKRKGENKLVSINSMSTNSFSKTKNNTEKLSHSDIFERSKIDPALKPISQMIQRTRKIFLE